MRKDKIEPNGNLRDKAFYSAVREEWPGVKALFASQRAAH